MTTVATFMIHAGYSYRPLRGESPASGRVSTAFALARAEVTAALAGLSVSWEPDAEPWDGCEPYNGPLWVALAAWDDDYPDCPYGPHRCVEAALGSIAIDSYAPDQDGYGRVVAAELSREVFGI